MHFIFPGLMQLVDLPCEALRVARLLHAHGFNAAYAVRLRLEPLDNNATLILEDRFGDRVEVLEVPPLELSLSGGKDPKDAFEEQRFEIRSRVDTKLKGWMRRVTGPDRGPATIERLSGDGLRDE